ncbi:MAG: hypothetical protein GYB19_05465 [Rhodospirillales bacterium]|nr:hypothetical protein [Rhodospirillales bacterium]
MTTGDFGATNQLFLVERTHWGESKANVQGGNKQVFIAALSTCRSLAEHTEVDQTGMFAPAEPDKQRPKESHFGQVQVQSTQVGDVHE